MQAPTDLANITVLVADDVRSMRAIVRSVLRMAGITKVLEVDNGESALKLLEQRRVDIVITDLLMKPIDGIEFVTMLRAPGKGLNQNVPVLMMSAHSQSERVQQAVSAGVTEFLVKPFSPANLLKRLESALTRNRLFVRSSSYCGPDRRRRINHHLAGRRLNDPR
jgi:two-component system, chemotaxis family, chemotaxis protein CheY